MAWLAVKSVVKHAWRAHGLARCIVLVPLVCVATSCVDDSFKHSLSEGHSSEADRRLVGTWEVFVADDPERYAGYRADTVCRVEKNPDAEGMLRIRQLGGSVLQARQLVLGGRDFLFIRREPDDAGQAGEVGRREQESASAGWLVPYDCDEAGKPIAREFKSDLLVKAIKDGSIEGSVQPVTSGFFLWATTADVPSVNLDSERSRAWIGANLDAISTRSGPVGRAIALAVTGLPNARMSDGAGPPPAVDQRVLGTTVSLPGLEVFNTYVVEATKDATTLKYSSEDPEIPGGTITTTVIDGVDYANVDQGDRTYLIFRYEFIEENTLVLVPPDPECIEAAIDANTLSAEVDDSGGKRRCGDVTSSADELRAFVRERAADCFPPPMSAGTAFVLRRVREGAGTAASPR